MAAAAVVLAVIACRAVARRRVARAQADPRRLWRALGAEPDGTPTVVAFSTPSCAECAVQAHVLGELDGLRVLHVDAADRPEVAGAFGVMTAPSTAVLARDGALVVVNHGLADGRRIREQLRLAEA